MGTEGSGMSGHYVPDAKRWFHRDRRIKRRIVRGMKYSDAAMAEERLQKRLRRYIDHIHNKEFVAKMAERFNGGIDPR